MGFLDFLFGDGRNQGRGTAVRGTAEAHGREVWASGTMDDGTYWEKGGVYNTPQQYDSPASAQAAAAKVNINF